MIALVHLRKSKQIHGRGVCDGDRLALSERSVQVVAFANDGALSGIEDLGKLLKVNGATSELKIGVCKGAHRVIGCDKVAHDVLRSFQVSRDRKVALSALLQPESVALKSNSASTFSRGVMVALCRRS